MAKFRTNTGDWKNVIIVTWVRGLKSYVGNSFKIDFECKWFFYNSQVEKEKAYEEIESLGMENLLILCEFGKIEAFIQQMEISKYSCLGRSLLYCYEESEMKKVPGV